MMQASGEPRHNVGNLRAIWSRLPLFWRFQLAGWATFVPQALATMITTQATHASRFIELSSSITFNYMQPLSDNPVGEQNSGR